MKPRQNLYLDADLCERLDALAAKPGSSKSAIVADALRAYLARRGSKELDDLLKNRIDRLVKQLDHIGRDQQVMLESLALFIHHHFTVTPPVPVADQAASRALARERFQAFIDQVGRQIAGERSLGRDLLARTATPETKE